MKLSLSWLKEHLQTDAALEAITDALTRLGLEVEGVHDPAARLAGFTVARVLTARPHPQADKLQVLEVDAGTGAALQVVCGAPNARAGLVGVFGAPGTFVPGSGITLKVSAIRGVESHGMMCSLRELELSDEHEGIVELPEDAPVGVAYADYAGLADPVIDVAITPNRQDCMGVRGIARDLAAAGLGTLRPLAQVYRLASIAPVPGDDPAPEVRTDVPEACPAFFAQAVAGVRNGPSPEWMRRRLAAVGQKPISALVDITNFLSLDLGRPLHVYDRAKLSGGLVARAARAGERMEALNGRTYALEPGMTVIADDQAVHDIAGIMGGAHSAVSEATTDVVIECAYFNPAAIARTGQALALTSDARQRFERGVDPAALDEGLAIATRLVIAQCGGRPSAVTRAGRPPIEHRTFRYDPSATVRIAGLAVAPERQRAILHDLGFGVDGAWTVRVPSWRRDIDGLADIVEEVVRVEGIDRVPAIPLPRPDGVARPTATPAQRLERTLRRAAAAQGLAEAVTWSFLPTREADAFGGAAWTLANPISEDLKAMRPSLLPGLLAAARRNLARGSGAVRLFEIGRRYLAEGERPTLAFVLAGDAPRDWRAGRATPDAYEAKALASALLGLGGAPADRLQVMEPPSGAWHPGRAGTLRLGPKTVLAAFGALHPATLKALDLDGPVVAGELYLDAIPARREGSRMRAAYAPPALQAVTRDFAFVVPEGVAAENLLRAVRGADKAAITDVALFDRFPLGEEGLSLALSVTLQPGERSFTEAELQAISDRIVAAAAKAGARLRG